MMEFIDVYEEVTKGLLTGEKVRVCARCGCEVVYDDWGDYVSPNYDCACLNCDEDLDFWETTLISKDKVKRFITEKDKEYYLKNGYLPTIKEE